jgi:hypothetical protein
LISAANAAVKAWECGQRLALRARRQRTQQWRGRSARRAHTRFARGRFPAGGRRRLARATHFSVGRQRRNQPRDSVVGCACPTATTST